MINVSFFKDIYTKVNEAYFKISKLNSFFFFAIYGLVFVLLKLHPEQKIDF